VPNEDRELVGRCLAGDQAACATLVKSYARMVGTVIWRATGDESVVDDLAQETFIRVFRALSYYDSRARLSTWIYTIAHRIAIDHLRKAGRWREDPLDERELEQGSGEPDPEMAFAQQEIDKLVRDGLERIPDKYRVPLVYAAIDGLDYATIASMLGVPIGTVKTLVFRGKRMLMEQIGEAFNAL